MRNILITGIGGDVACAIIRCFLDEKSVDNIYGIDVKQYTPYMGLLTKTFVAPRYTDDAYIPFIKKLIAEYGITHFIPTTEHEIIFADREREYFKLHNVKLIINNPGIIDICISKYKTADFLKSNSIIVPKTYYAEEYCGELGFPFIMKPDRGCGSRDLRVIYNEEEWMNTDKQGMVCQQMVGGADSEYTVGVFSNGEIVNSITFKRQLGYGGLSAFVECCEIPEISKIAKKVAKVFSLKGSFNIQFRQDGNKYYIFEINPRLSSTTGFRHKFGFKDAVWWLDMIDGKTISKYEDFPMGSIGLKVLDDMVILANRGGYWTGKIIRYSGGSCQVTAA